MSNQLGIASNIEDHDDLYQKIINMHQGLTNEESQMANAKLILMLANHIADADVLSESITLVRKNVLRWRNPILSK